MTGGKRTNLFNVQYLRCDSPIEYGPFNYEHRDIGAIEGISPDITGGIDQLAQVNLAIFNGNKTNEVCPGHGGGSYYANKKDVLKMQCN